MSKLLTVSIAAYNVENYIETTLKSCIVSEEYQKYLEVLIVNDGSTDSTLEIANKYENDYSEIFRVINKKNGGYGSTINSAIEVASGKYFRLLDGDDWYDTKELQKFLEKLKKIDADLVLNDFSICFEKTAQEKPIKLLIDNEGQICNIDKLTLRNNVAMYSFCYNTELLRKNKIHITEKCFYTDIEYIVNPLVFVKNYIYVSNNLYQYRVGVEGQSISLKGMQKHYKDAFIIMKSVLEKSIQAKVSSNIQEIIELLSAMMVKMAFKCRMSVNISQENRKALLKEDKMVKEMYPGVYKRTNSFMFRILRMTNYWMYPIWVVIMKTKEKLYGKA